ncbi:MAG TPA: hypothetical protein PK514_01525 [Spirochaetota bacterium]|nr:hypothetical protein [Spirochaetota bacterium]
MRVVHVLKRVETIDNDIKELRKLEKTLTREKSFTTPIYMTIEKQINIMLDERIKLLNLKIENPPENLVAEIEGEKTEAAPEPLQTHENKSVKKAKPAAKPAQAKPQRKPAIELPDDDDIPMLTQDQIDARFNAIKSEDKKEAAKPASAEKKNEEEIKAARKQTEDTDDSTDDTAVKLLDVALEKGTLNKKVIDREKKVRFFRENFPAD